MKSVIFHIKPLFLTGVTGLLLIGTGCKDQSIQVYTIPKETNKPAVQTASASTQTAPHLHWEELPANWSEVEASSMRAASIRIQGPDETEADVGAIPLPMMAGKELEFVNMWRSDLNLAETSTNAIADLREDASILGSPGSLFEMVSDDLLIDGKFKKRVIVGMASVDQTTWFIKLTGPDQLVASEKQNFINWLANVEVHAGSHGEPAPQMSPTTSNPGLPQWKIPEGWMEQQPGQMLLASFALPGGNADVTVMSLGGDGGGLLPNVNRWRGQLGLPNISSSQLDDVVEPIETADGQGTLIDIQGEDQRLLAVVIPHNGRSWFYKSMGASDVVAQQRDAFVEFAQTAKH